MRVYLKHRLPSRFVLLPSLADLRQMICCDKSLFGFMRLLIVLVLYASASAFGNITSIEDLTPDKLVSVWEAIVQKNGVVGPGVYQMRFTTPTNAYFVASWPGLSEPLFVGRLSSSELVAGHIKLKFIAVADLDSDYDSVEIEGRANHSGDEGSIDGKITMKRRNGKTSADPVIFLNSLWAHSIADASTTAQKVLEDAEIKHPPIRR